tara:strand:- start:264 stop:446 length:183 start_codon:yes stop_codon:yes gene_type:complete
MKLFNSNLFIFFISLNRWLIKLRIGLNDKKTISKIFFFFLFFFLLTLFVIFFLLLFFLLL